MKNFERKNWWIHKFGIRENMSRTCYKSYISTCRGHRKGTKTRNRLCTKPGRCGKSKLFESIKCESVCNPESKNLKFKLTLFIKGQLILKGLFGFFNSPKKRTKNFCPSRLGQKLTFSSSFFGRIEDTKVSFRD